MDNSLSTVDLSRSADEVWALVGGFGDLESWMSGVDSCTVDGDVRTVGTMGMEIQERLVERDDAARSLSYSIVGGVPLEHHKATITVTPAGDGCTVTWACESEPEGTGALFGPIYQGALDQLKARLEG